MPSASSLSRLLSEGRQAQLLRELREAWKSAPNGDLKTWLKDVTGAFASITVRRGRNIGRLLRGIAGGLLTETQGAYKAQRRGSLGTHLRSRGSQAASMVARTGTEVRRNLRLLRGAVQDNPGEAVPRAIVGALAFVAASGGPDGNGGVPDLDLKLGIDAHRNVFFHSFFAGVVVETLLYATATGIGVLHRHLPRHHDPIWDAIAQNKDVYLSAAATGAGAGIAYHLFVDAAIQPSAYHDLPFSMPMEGHQAALAASAMVEAIDVPHKGKTYAGLKTDASSRSQAGTDDAKRLLDAYKKKMREEIVPTTDDEERKRHFALVKQVLRLDDRVASCLTKREREILTRFGKWLGAIDEGILRPVAPDQLRFVEVCRGRVEAQSEMELAWLKYRGFCTGK